MKRPSITGLLTMAFAATAGTVFAITGFAIYLFQIEELRSHQTAELQARLVIVRPLVEHTRTAKSWTFLQDKLTSFTPTDDSLRFQLSSTDPHFTFGKPWPRNTRIKRNADGSFFALFDGRMFLGVETVAEAYDERPPVRIVIASDYGPVQYTRMVLGIFILVVSIGGIAITTSLAWFIARRGLLPLERLTRSVATLNPNDPSLRLPTGNLPAELEGITAAFNGALGRIQAAHARLAAFNADVAHELRTPLGNLIGQTQVALSRSRSSDELEEVLSSNLEELERLKLIVNDMLFLARADQGALAVNRIDTSLGELAKRTAEFFEDLLDQHDVKVQVVGDALVSVEPALLGRAFANLLENAVRHGRPSSTVMVMIEPAEERISIAVINPGDPIDPQALDKLFDRFYRVDPARTGSVETHGLGLAIVKAIAIMHEGSVFARYRNGYVFIGLLIPAG